MAKKRSKTSTRAPAPKPASRPAPARNRAILILAAAGMLVTAYLTGTTWWAAAPAFCDAGSGCDVIRQSRWSTVMGLPLSFWGFLVYALLAFVAFRPMAAAKRWTWLWRITVMGLAISLYLTAVSLISLGAACLWCVLSLCIMTAIFVVLIVQRPPTPANTPWWTLPLNTGCMALIVVILMHVYYNSDLLSAPPDPRLQALASHLTESGAKYYGASWCASCQRQAQMFRQAADDLPYIECSPAGRGGPLATVCAQQNISSFPTWIIGRTRIEGALTPEELARHSGFDWDPR